MPVDKANVCVVTGSRAEFGQLVPLLERLCSEESFSVNIVATGTHVSPEGDIDSELVASGFVISGRISIPSIADNSRRGMVRQIGEVSRAFSNYLATSRPDLLILIGDRYETFGAAIAAYTMLVPIAHICGGSTSAGALDEAYRHSITKMASLHFVTCEMYRKRVIQLGEEPSRIFNVGSLAIENCLHLNLLPEDELRWQVGLPPEDPYCVVTFHPGTLEGKASSGDEVRELIRAMDSFPDFHFVITLSNADSGGNAINEIWKSEGGLRDNFHVHESLGTRRYLSALKYSQLMLGNSSSGTTEGPAMGIPVVNIGDRQKGRLFAASTVHCKPVFAQIVASVEKALSPKFQALAKTVSSPFGDGTASIQIVDILKSELYRSIDVRKEFYDIDFEVVP